MIKKLFSPRGLLPSKTRVLIEASGAALLLTAWFITCHMEWVSPGILPSPWAVLSSFPELHFEDALVRNLGWSLYLNSLGYLEAIVVAIPCGFVVGIFPIFRSLLGRYIAATRYLPLTAITGLFIAWFGIETNMKVQFLAIGIIIYLLPTVVQRIDEVQQVYLDTAKTLGATRWQRIRYVFIPDVMAKVWGDVGVLTGISWTYMIVAEIINKDQGGIGALAYTAARQSRIDKTFACLILIILTGFLWDKIHGFSDRIFFRWKHS